MKSKLGAPWVTTFTGLAPRVVTQGDVIVQRDGRAAWRRRGLASRADVRDGLNLIRSNIAIARPHNAALIGQDWVSIRVCAGAIRDRIDSCAAAAKRRRSEWVRRYSLGTIGSVERRRDARSGRRSRSGMSKSRRPRGCSRRKSLYPEDSKCRSNSFHPRANWQEVVLSSSGCRICPRWRPATLGCVRRVARKGVVDQRHGAAVENTSALAADLAVDDG